MRRTLTKRLGSRRGNAMIEFALASLILIPLFLGAFQFGYTFYVYNLLCSQIRAAARYGSIRAFYAADSAKYYTAVKNVVLYGNAAGTGTLIEPGMTASNIEVLLLGSNGAAASSTNIPVNLTVRTASGNNAYKVNAAVTSFSFTGKPYLTIPYTGQFAPSGNEP